MGGSDVIGISLPKNKMAASAYRALAVVLPVATARALNKSGASGVSVLVKAAAADIGIKQAAIREKLVIKSATGSRPVFRVEVEGRRISLYEFKAKGRYPSGGKGTGVTAKLPGGAGRYPHAFIARLGGTMGVFERKGRAQFPIRKLRGPSLPKVVGKVSRVFFEKSREVLKKNMEHEIKYETRRIGDKTIAA